jgi:hypothetical protein
MRLGIENVSRQSQRRVIPRAELFVESRRVRQLTHGDPARILRRFLELAIGQEQVNAQIVVRPGILFFKSERHALIPPQRWTTNDVA